MHKVASSLDNTLHANEPLRAHVERVVRQYFSMLDDEMPTDLYELILKEIEQPLLAVVLEKSRGNQTKCAQMLGLNRGTLRKKLKTYGLM
ncbi:DNA-binding transcriptional regulator Fis [Psychrobacter sp.]|uniref:DNA-binding transcriptional regulator Fis n=1 Tax=unclassified Psychrobacter TaxID=196806 RepID=UPI003918326B